MSILKLKPACKDYPWGGQRLKEEYNVQYSGDILAECWELSCHPDGPSTIENGQYAGLTLQQYLDRVGPRALGSNCQIFNQFPILIKYIDAKQNLSIQVHPNNMDAMEAEHQYGKTEAWYILDAKPGAFLYLGFEREITKDEVRKHIEENTLTDVLHKVPVRKGELYYIPAGTVHAICKDILIAEIQQSSNITYRVYDYGRRGIDGKTRPLHIEQALRVMKLQPARFDYNFGGHLARSAYFTVDLLHSGDRCCCDEESFTSLLILDGEGQIRCGEETMDVRKGDSLFIPADSGECMLSGSIQALCTRVGTV